MNTARLPSRTRSAALAFALSCVGMLSALPGMAQPAPRFGVALSGGGARGLAHIGVLQVLDEAGLAPDLVVGTSMGAIIGGLYASGWTGEELDSLAGVLDWDAAFSDTPEYGASLLPLRLDAPPTVLTLPVQGGVTLPLGLIAGQSISALLARLTWPVAHVRAFDQLPVPFAAIATDFETGEPVRLTGGTPLATAIRASLAIPAVFTPIEIGGRLLVDGGVVRNLPAEDTRALGADVVLCVDVSDTPQPADSVRTLVDVLVQTTTLGLAPLTEAQRPYCDVLISPDLTGFDSDAFEDALMFAQRGAAAMRAQLDELKALIPNRSAPRPVVSGTAWGRLERSRRVYAVEFEGLSTGQETFARERIGLADTLRAPWDLRAEDIGEWVRRLHGAGAFEQVTYRLVVDEGDPSRARVVLSVTPRDDGALGLGVRFDSERRGAALVTLDLSGDALVPQSTLRFRARLGRDISATAAIGGLLGLTTNAAWEIRGEYEEAPAFALAAEAPLGFRSEAVRAVARVIRFRGNRFGLGIAAGGEAYWFSDVPQNAPDDAFADGVLALVRLLAAYESLDRPQFPRRGLSLTAIAEQAAGDERYGHYVATGRAFLPVVGARSWRLVLHSRLVLARATSSAPPHRLFGVGGLNLNAPRDPRRFDFAGYGTEALVGRAAHLASLGVRLDVGSRRLNVQADVGNAYPDWGALFADATWGWAASLAQETPVGPVQIGLSGRRWDALRAEFAFGYTF